METPWDWRIYSGHMEPSGLQRGLTLFACDREDLHKECSSLDVGFEAHGDIGILVVSPLPGAGPGCVHGLNGDARIFADPTKKQVVTVVAEKIGAHCPPD